MFNHREPPNVFVEDIDSSEFVRFILVDECVDDVNFSIDTSKNESNRSNDGYKKDLFISYGLSTNPYRFLIRFGFCNTQMIELFCQVLFSNPSDEMVDLGCNDRKKMVYRTQDGAISNTVWDTVLYSLLDQVPEDQALFYKAHQEGENDQKSVLHERYIIETSLVLRKHVVKELSELRESLSKIDSIMNTMSAMELEMEHPRLPMIRQHNEFIFRTFEKARQQIDARVKGELKRRK